MTTLKQFRELGPMKLHPSHRVAPIHPMSHGRIHSREFALNHRGPFASGLNTHAPIRFRGVRMDLITCLGLFFVFYAWGLISIWTTRDYQTNDIWPFFWPSVLLGIVLYYSLPKASLSELSIINPNEATLWTILVALILPVFFSFVYVGLKQPSQKSAGMPIFVEGGRKWVVSDPEDLRGAFIDKFGSIEWFLFSENPIAEITDQDVSDWLEDIGKICGESGEIIEIDENGMVHMKFKYGKKEILPMGALTDNPEEKAEKGWWDPSDSTSDQRE